MTKWEKNLRSFPPFLVRLCARKNHGRTRLRRREIISKSGLDGRTVDRLSRARSWGDTGVSVIIAYTDACGVDLSDLRRHKEYLKSGKHAAWKEMPGLYVKMLKDTS